MKTITKLRKEYTEMLISKLSDKELYEKYYFITNEIESRREMVGLGLASDIEYKYQLMKEMKKRGLSYE